MKQIFSIFTFFTCLLINSQIKLEVKSVKKNTYSQNYIELKLINTSESYYALPIDMSDFKPDFFGKSCDFNDENEITFFEKNDMLLRILFIDNITNKFEENIYNFPTPQDLLHSEIVRNQYNKKKDSVKFVMDTKIKKWKDLNNIKKDDTFAKLNYLLFSNIILLKPKQEIIYKVNIDYSKLYTSRMYQTDSFYYYYNLKNSITYSFMLNYCIDSRIYKYLTRKQKKILKGYKLYSGNLNSNILKWE